MTARQTAEKDVHRSCVPRERYRFVHGGPVLVWEKRIAGDSRVEQITCTAEWFYGQMRAIPPEETE